MPRVRLFDVRRVVRMRTDVRRYAMDVLDAIGRPPLAQDDGSIGLRTLHIGTNPIRVLLIGGGLAVGYGVQRRCDAVDGPLAARLAEATGRGVVLDDRAVQHVRTGELSRQLGPTGALTFGLVFWCPSFVEGLDRLSLAAWRDDLRRLIEDLGAERRVPVLLTHMPIPSGLHPKALIARPWVHRINRMIADVAARYPHVADVPTEPFFLAEAGRPVTDPAYFARVAERLVAPALALLGIPVRAGVPAAA